jgi:hypothetical protein
LVIVFLGENKSTLHERLKIGFSRKDYSYLIDKIEPEIVKINEEICVMRKLYISNEESVLSRNSVGSIIHQTSSIFDTRSIST